MKILLFATMGLSFYNVGTIWAHEVDIFRSWQYVGEHFRRVQAAHWRKLPYWVLVPATLTYIATIALLWYRLPGTPLWAIVSSFAAQTCSTVLTVLYWGRWQAALSRDPAGAKSAYLKLILLTHWIRTTLITIAGVALLLSAIMTP